MGLGHFRRGEGLLLIFLAANLLAAPKLRLQTTAIGPVSVAISANGPSQTIEARNAGDGALNLQLSSNVTWIVPTVGVPRGCSQGQTGTCVPVQIALQTLFLTKGTYTGTVTVNDPNAVDAPQTITVTVQMGGGVPDQVDLYAPPGSSSPKQTFNSSSSLTWKVTTNPSDGSWLAISSTGAGSFGFNIAPVLYQITGTARAGMAVGNYSGSIAFSGSSVPAENKTVPVTLHVTTQPIADVPQSVSFRIAQDGKKQTTTVLATNKCLGTLSISAATTAGASWLSALPQLPNSLPITVDPTGLSPGLYSSSVSLLSNAANSPSVVNVQLEVVPVSAPLAKFQGVVNNATFEADDPVAPGDIAAVFGEQFSSEDPQQGTQLPLVTTLGGAQVFVNNLPVPLYYSSYGQINFQVPYETAIGEALVRVDREGQRGNTVSVQVKQRAPRILRLGIGDYGIIVNQDGSLPIPATPGILSHPAKVGDTLVIYAIGLGATSPAAVTGAPAPGIILAAVSPPPKVFFDGASIATGIPADPIFAGLTPSFVGLYQINVTIPSGTPSGNNVQLYLDLSDAPSNHVQIAVQ
jgi:uncharacterized protein (TIGR03437 family)